MTEELEALICKFCNGEGVLHSRAAFPRNHENESIFYQETHRACPQCEGNGIRFFQ